MTLRPVQLWVAIFLLVVMWLLSCVPLRVDPYFIARGFMYPTVWLRDSLGYDGAFHFFVVSLDSVGVQVLVDRGSDLDLDYEKNSLLVDVIVFDTKLEERLHFVPDSIIVQVKGSRLPLIGSQSGICYKKYNVCSYRSTFRLVDAGLQTPSLDTLEPWCIIDLRGALTLDAVPLEFKSIFGWLPGTIGSARMHSTPPPAARKDP